MCNRRSHCRFILIVLLSLTTRVRAEIEPGTTALYLDFEKDDISVTLVQGMRRVKGRFGGAPDLTNALQYDQVELSRSLNGIEAMSVGGWFFPRRSGEQRPIEEENYAAVQWFQRWFAEP